MCEKLKIAAGQTDFEVMAEIQKDMKRLVEKHPDVNKTKESPLPQTSIAEDQLMPKTPNYFN